MFIVPLIIAAVIGFTMLFVGKYEPEELAWNCAEEIFGEVKAKTVKN